MISTINPKTIARRKLMKKKYSNQHNYLYDEYKINTENQDMVVHPSEIGLSSYHTKKEHSIIIAYESDIEGLYCDNPELLYRNSNKSDNHLTCQNIYWNCNDCMTCDKRRRLHIMKQIDKRFRYHTGFNLDDLYTITMPIGDSDPSKLSKKIKYLQNKVNYQLMWLIKDTNQKNITFLMRGVMSDNTFNFLDGYRLASITKDEVINMISVRDKYRFLGLFYHKVPDVGFAGMTEEEIKELSKVKAVKQTRCGCGELIIEGHTIRKTTSQYDFDTYVIPEDHYVEEHKKFKNKYIK